MLCLWNPWAPALEQGMAPSLLLFHSSKLCLLYTLAQKKQQMARLLLAPPCHSKHPQWLHQSHLTPRQIQCHCHRMRSVTAVTWSVTAITCGVPACSSDHKHWQV